MPNPVLVELTRADLVESVHTGALAISDSRGTIVASIGDIDRPIYPRSAVKAFQALPVLETGTAAQYGYGNKEIALLCASHSGTVEHATVAAEMLRRAGQTESALGCGAHDPMQERAARELYKAGQPPSQLHNNCSGKHSGMVATCVHCGDPVAGYWNTNHPHQRRIAKVLSEFTGTDLGKAHVGTDGCSAPNWAAPLRNLAHAFARFITRDGLDKDRARHCETIATACMAEPFMVAGPDRLDTSVMTALRGRVFMKTGAEGVYCGGLPELGLGFAIKIDDGNKRGSEAVTMALLQRALVTSEAFGAIGPMKNWRGITTGETRTTDDLSRALDKVRKP